MQKDIITSPKEFAGFASELLDSEIQEALAVIVSVQKKYQYRSNTTGTLEALRDEALTRLAEIGVLATLDPAPCLYGDPPILEILGKVKGDATHKDGFDHEKKRAEILSAHDRGEYFLGEKETPNRATKAKKRDRRRKKK